MIKKADVLIVDSHDGELTLMSHLFQDEGLDVIKAHTGEEALKYMNDYEFSVVVTDICMPEMTGVKLSKEIFNKVPVVMISSNTEENPFEGKIEDICDCFIDKADLKDSLVPATLKAIERYRINREMTDPRILKVVA